MSEAKQITLRPIVELTPYANNARIHSPEQVKQLAASIREFGFVNPVLVDGAGMIIAGHGRVMAAKEIGMAEVPCLAVEGLTEAQIRAYILADNQLALNAGWDDELLRVELRELAEMGVDLELTGFDMAEIDALINGGGQVEGLTDEDEVPDVPDAPVTVEGDIWLLGRHRLMCGDSTDAGSVALLMDRRRAGLMNTDPPYGIAYANDDRPNPGVAKPRVAKPRVANDTLADEQLQTFLEKTFTAAVDVALTESAAWYLWHAHLTQGYFAAAAAANVVLHRQIIWVKPVLLLGRGHYHWKHEPCFMGWVKGNQPPDYGLGKGERTQTTIWEIGSISQAERKEFNHSSPKPVGLFDVPQMKHLKSGEVCYEPFAGSGPQFIAAEKNGFCCFGLELMPKYCDVIINRWQNFTGKTATLEATGQTFAEVAEARRGDEVPF